MVLYRFKNNERPSLSSYPPSITEYISRIAKHTMTSIRELFLEWRQPYNKRYPRFEARFSIDRSSPFFPGIKDKLRSNQRNSVIREYRETIPQIHLVGSLVIRNLPFACVEINFQWEKTAGRNLVLRGGEEIRSNGVTDAYYNSIEKNILFFSFLAFKYEIRIHLICYGVSEEIRQWMI